MKPEFLSRIILITFIGALLFSLSGCGSQRITVKAVDATTMEPLAGVVTKWLQVRNQMFMAEARIGPTNLPASGQNGVIEVDGVHRTWGSLFVFSCPGYTNVYGYFENGSGLDLGAQVTYFDFPPGHLEDEFYISGTWEKAVKSNGCFIVPMPKK